MISWRFGVDRQWLCFILALYLYFALYICISAVCIIDAMYYGREQLFLFDVFSICYGFDVLVVCLYLWMFYIYVSLSHLIWLSFYPYIFFVGYMVHVFV